VWSDLSVFHRITRPERMHGLHFLMLVELLPSYQGAVAAAFRVVVAKYNAQQQEQGMDVAVHPSAADLIG
jgi:hypothetical protein